MNKKELYRKIMNLEFDLKRKNDVLLDKEKCVQKYIDRVKEREEHLKKANEYSAKLNKLVYQSASKEKCFEEIVSQYEAIINEKDKRIKELIEAFQ